MKKIFLFILFIVISNCIKSQKIIHFDVFYKAKLEIMHNMLSNNELSQNPVYAGENGFVLSGDFTFNRFLIFMEYSEDYYSVGYTLKKEFIKHAYVGVIESIGSNNTYGLGINYYLYPVKRKFNILSGFGISFFKRAKSFSSSHQIQRFRNSEIVVNAYVDEQTRLSKNYFFLSPRLELSYTPVYFLTLYFRTGFSVGFQTIGYTSGWYEIENRPRKYVKNSTKGSNIFFGFGSKINFILSSKKKYSLAQIH